MNRATTTAPTKPSSCRGALSPQRWRLLRRLLGALVAVPLLGISNCQPLDLTVSGGEPVTFEEASIETAAEEQTRESEGGIPSPTAGDESASTLISDKAKPPQPKRRTALIAPVPIEPHGDATRSARPKTQPSDASFRWVQWTIGRDRNDRWTIRHGDNRIAIHLRVAEADQLASARTTIETVVRALLADFGPPAYTGRLDIAVEPNAQGHAFLRQGAPGYRLITIDPFNMIVGQDHFLAHEFFHALYQTPSMLARPKWEVESWATYAQYRFRYHGRSNPQILQHLVEAFPSLVEGQPPAIIDDDRWVRLRGDLLIKQYLASAMPLFARQHHINALILRNAIDGGSIRLQKHIVLDIQSGLTALGYDAGPLDGLVGTRTLGAAEALHRARHMPFTGKLDSNTLQAISQ